MKTTIFHCGYVILFFFFIGCASVESTNKIKGEVVAAKVNEEDDLLAFNSMQGQNVSSRGMEEILGKGVSLAAEGVKKLIAIDREKYTAEYTTALREMYFYKQPSVIGPMDPQQIQFNGFSLTRWVDDKTGRKDTALFLSLKVDTENPYDIINNSLFRLKFDDFKLNYAKCKIPDARWYFPWTWFFQNDESINLDIEVIFKASWMTQSGVYYDQIEIGKFIHSIRGLPIRNGQEGFVKENLLGKRLNGYSILVPRSYGNYFSNQKTVEECWGQGLYTVQINIKESSKEKFIETLVLDNSSTLVDQMVKRLK